MKRLLTIIVFMLTAIVAVNAQGSVTVTQSAEIDALVNGKKAAKKANKERQRVESQHESQKTSAVNTSKKQDTKKLTVPKLNDHRPEISRPENIPAQPVRPVGTKLVKRLVKRPHIPTDEEIDGTYLVTKRVKKGNKKVRGFRVQAYSGGNTRIAHQQADAAGQKAKELFPDQPIYVHFYSPRWMCLIGNFTNYNAAKKVMRTLRKNGFPHANIIRTMVTIKTSQFVN
ncbi:SPOR domain-containing protein [Prevotella histicola]|uniref:SPOR domain-containing protein n=1 Tax=Prevotella histicola TaxID=470565 RepID=UPI001CB1E246|nr:SPOR domain-containing protein [Prevotella histicola]MBF1417048.1 SPOR domain-containing protein [Prevotella histicola]